MPNKIATTENEVRSKEKKREDLVPELVLLENDREVEAFSLGDAALYLNMSHAGLKLMLARFEKQGRPVPVYRKKHVGQCRYLLKSDLDNLRRVEPVNIGKTA